MSISADNFSANAIWDHVAKTQEAKEAERREQAPRP